MTQTPDTAPDFPITRRNRVRRRPQRGFYDRATVYGILDAGLVCHVAYVIDGQPYCTPTSYWREGDRLYWHGSSASRMLERQAEGLPVCLTVTHLDGLVLARCGFNCSMNYRAVMAYAPRRRWPTRRTSGLRWMPMWTGCSPGGWPRCAAPPSRS